MIIQKRLKFYSNTAEINRIWMAIMFLLMLVKLMLLDLFEIKEKITGKTGNNDTKNVKIMVPLK